MPDAITHLLSTQSGQGQFFNFTVGAGKPCAPKKITFYDWPSETIIFGIRSPANHWHKNFHLMAVCHKTDSQGNWDSNKYYTLAEIDYAILVDNYGAVYTNIWNSGTAGDCGKIIVDSITKKENLPAPDGVSGNSSGAEIKAHFIGCCDDDIAWIQIITNYDKSTTYFDVPKDPITGEIIGQTPYYYQSAVWGKTGTGFLMSDHSSDYTPPNSDYPIHCP
jgi:hypothetical protein